MQIKELIVKNFNDNIEYFQQYHKELFKQLAALDSAITNGYYQQNYELVYEDDGFDVYELKTGNFLYNKQSNTHTNLALKSLNLDTNENCFETFFNQNVADIEIDKEFKNHLSGTSKIINLSKNNTIKRFNKFIFFGVGLGLHISKMAQKINAKYYFIVEEDLELFRLSLFTLNYKELAKDAKLIFNIFDDDFTKNTIFYERASSKKQGVHSPTYRFSKIRVPEGRSPQGSAPWMGSSDP